jgi:hypothetical protein
MEEEEEELESARHMLNRRRHARNKRRHGGSIPGRVRIHRDHMSGDARSERTTLERNRCTRMLNFVGGISHSHIHFAMYIT